MSIVQRILMISQDEPFKHRLRELLCPSHEICFIDDLHSFTNTLALFKPQLILTEIPIQSRELDQLNDIPVISVIDDDSQSERITGSKQQLYLVKTATDDTFCQLIDSQNTPVAQDPSSKQVLELAKRVAPKHASVLISGESGVGKEVVARFIHDNSNCANGPFVAINCAAIPDNMLEASLFGYDKGAFTGAYKSNPGKFEQAQGGTLLLDEVSEMPLALQAKLLRVLQEREVERLGGQKLIKLNVRIISTTNRNLQLEVQKERFRKDLYYRLNIFPIHWIPLRERPLDILPLAEYLLAYHAKLSRCKKSILSESAKQKLMQYSWPGNAREMDNVIQRSLILQSGDAISAQEIHLDEVLLISDIEQSQQQV